MGAATAIMGAAGGALGGLAGSQSDKSSQTTTHQLANPSDAHIEAYAQMRRGMSGYEDLINKGPGASDYTAGLDAERNYAAMLDKFSQTGGGPEQGDFDRANQYATGAFQGQQQALNSAFSDQLTQANRQAALMGRSTNDPVLQAKLAVEQTRQRAQLNANQGAFATQYAFQQPQMRLGFAQQHAQVLGGLATQAMANRQALAAMGQSITNSERGFQLAQSGITTTQVGGGGMKGGISGMLGGIGSFASLAGMFGNMGGGKKQADPADGRIKEYRSEKTDDEIFGGGDGGGNSGSGSSGGDGGNGGYTGGGFSGTAD